MSVARFLALSTVAIGGTWIAIKPEARQKIKKAVASSLREFGNVLDPVGKPPMWSDDETESVDEPVDTIEEDTEEEEEVRTNQGFKVIR
jgi:hypothetical protein